MLDDYFLKSGYLIDRDFALMELEEWLNSGAIEGWESEWL